MSVASQKVTGGQIVVNEFIRHDIKRVYCVPGESYLAVIDALFDVQDDIQQITCRHESGAGMMALAEAELSTKPAVCFVTRGPGATNVSIAVHIAKQASVPLVLCVGQVASDRVGRESFQEMDYQQFFGSTTKAVFNIETPQHISETMQRAFSLAKSGRPGPVVLVFPEDVLREETERFTPLSDNRVDNMDSGKAVKNPDSETAASLASIREKLSNCQRPLIIAGGSQWTDETAKDLQGFAEQHGIPVLTAFRRNDVMSNHSSSFAGYLGLNQHQGVNSYVEDSDCVLVLGARLDEPTTSDYSLPGIFQTYNSETNRPETTHLAEKETAHSGQENGFNWIHVYPDFSAIPATPIAPIRVESDVASFLHLIKPEPFARQNADSSWLTQCRSGYEKSTKEDLSAKYDKKFLELPMLMHELTAMLPEDAVVTTDAGNFSLWPQRFCQFTRPGRMLAPVNGAMGYGVPSGIAASLANPEKTVVTFVGDGGMMMTGMEMATAMKYGAKPIIIVFNNRLYGTIDSHQQRHYPGRTHGNDLRNPDFVQYAESFGVAAVRVKTVHDFANAFLQAKQLGEISLIELMLYAERSEPIDEFDS